MNSRRLNWLFGYQAVVYAAGLLLATGLVSDWGAWYSTSLPYRTQTEALLKGDLAVSRSVADLKLDHTWSEQGVHQVWGLGVPLWRLPFEGAAKFCGFDGFPDRLAFGLFALLVSIAVLRVWTGPSNFGSANVTKPSDGWVLITGFGGVLLILLFPPFLTLLQARGAVWEEAIAYEYLFGILQLSLLVAFVQRPTIGRLLLVCALAGIGGIIRPTLIFYGFASLILAVVAWVVNVSQTFKSLAPSARETSATSAAPGTIADAPGDRPEARLALSRVLVPALLGLFLFGLGGGLLWFTNLKRFGNGFEFGHSLNVQYLYGSMHATRFDHPFEDEPVTGATLELFGALFAVEKFNGADWYQKNIFPGQSRTVRWREFYFRTYDRSYLPLLLLAWCVAITAGFKVQGSGCKMANGLVPCGSPTGGPMWRSGDNFCETESATRNNLSGKSPSPASIPRRPSSWPNQLPTLLILGLWSLLAVIPLAAFYLYAPVISSRYLMDLAPAFAAALVGAWLWIASHCIRRWSRILVCLLFCAWLGAEIFLSRSVYGGPTSVTVAELEVLREQRPANDGSSTNAYTAGDDNQSLNSAHTVIPFDHAGWNAETGVVMPLVILFVKDVEFLELDLKPHSHSRIAADPQAIRAKVGLEFLERERITEIADGWRLRFRGPQQGRWRDGLQTAFVATVAKEFLAEDSTPWILKAVRWRAISDNVSEHR